MSLGISAAAWAGIGAIGSIGLGVYGANQAGNASDAQQAANREALLLQQQNRDIGLNLAEPNRYLGYQALGDLSSLYGYQQAPYQTADQLIGASGGGVGSGPIQVNGRNASDGIGAFGVSYFGGGDKRFGGTIDPVSGTVNIGNVHNGPKADKFEALLTNYLRTGEGLDGKHPRLNRFIREIDQLRASGYQYDPNAADKTTPTVPTQGVGTASAGTSADGTAGNMSRFFTSPDYQFRLTQGTQAIDRSAAARGGALSGNAIRAGTEYAGNLASGEYNNYVNRLMQMAGMGTAANNTAAQTVNNYAANAGNLAQQQGDARASGIMGQYGSLVGGFNGASNILGNYFGALNQPVGG